MKSFSLFRRILKQQGWGVSSFDTNRETIEALTSLQLRNLPLEGQNGR